MNDFRDQVPDNPHGDSRSAQDPDVQVSVAQEEHWIWPIYKEEWEVRREDFRCLKLFLYAVNWARSIFVGMSRKQTDEEDDETVVDNAFVLNASCRSRQNDDGNEELIFSIPGPIPETMVKKGITVVLSVSDPFKDGRWNHLMKVERISGSDMIILEPRKNHGIYLTFRGA